MKKASGSLCRMWYHIAVILLMWASVEDWKAMNGSLDSTEKSLEAVSSHLLNKVAEIAAGTVGWIFMTALKMNINSVFHDTMLVPDVQKHLEELQQHIFALEQEPHGLEEPIISYRKAVSDSDDDDECYETVGPCLTAKPIVQQKVKCEKLMAPRGASSRGLQYE